MLLLVADLICSIHLYPPFHEQRKQEITNYIQDFYTLNPFKKVQMVTDNFIF